MRPGRATRCAKTWCGSSPCAKKRYARGSNQGHRIPVDMSPAASPWRCRRDGASPVSTRLLVGVHGGFFLLQQFQRLGERQVRGHPLEAGKSLGRTDGETLEQEDLSGEVHAHAGNFPDIIVEFLLLNREAAAGIEVSENSPPEA